ncbi:MULTISPECIES: immunity protein YezG family protein [unclassified Sphingobacterium]|uniref:immunity protein YezG family protein n=1 Tax=unclassified Sphingobacterium TaxID=2609468 RepID=UPI0025DBA640|nr:MULTISPECIES: immunity protein YezG family protein [unclassified Sphingobacterium]
MKTVDEIYGSITNNINSVINEEWIKAELNIEAIGEMASFTGNYINSNNEKKQIDVDEFDFQLTFDILELHKITTEDDSNRWNKAFFFLRSDGEFEMQFVWDQELHDEVVRLSKE